MESNHRGLLSPPVYEAGEIPLLDPAIKILVRVRGFEPPIPAPLLLLVPKTSEATPVLNYLPSNPLRCKEKGTAPHLFAIQALLFRYSDGTELTLLFERTNVKYLFNFSKISTIKTKNP